MGTLLKIKQGQHFKPSFAIHDKNQVYTNFRTDFHNVIIYCFTVTDNKFKFSITEKTGYGRITLVNDTKITLTVTPQQTKSTAPGPMMAEIMGVNADLSLVKIFTGKVCLVEHSCVKDEIQ